jgi:hypothetical protein
MSDPKALSSTQTWRRGGRMNDPKVLSSTSAWRRGLGEEARDPQSRIGVAFSAARPSFT